MRVYDGLPAYFICCVEIVSPNCACFLYPIGATTAVNHESSFQPSRMLLFHSLLDLPALTRLVSYFLHDSVPIYALSWIASKGIQSL